MVQGRGFNLGFLHVDIPFSQYYLLKRPCSFPHWMIWHPCQKLTINVRIYFWTFSSIPVIDIANLMPVLYLLFICSSVLSFETEKCETSLLFFLCIEGEIATLIIVSASGWLWNHQGLELTLFLGMMENGITEIKFYFVLFVLASQLYTSTGCYRIFTL